MDRWRPPISPTPSTSTPAACVQGASTGTASPSETGRPTPARTRTAPAAHGAVDAVRFAFCTCQKWEDGFYNAFAHLAEEDLDLVLHLGDYTYEYGIDPATGGVRGVTLPAEYAEETVTLDQFRLRHALYKTDSDLQRAHARFPWVTVWDDHEVDNDYTADIPEDGTPPEEFRAAPHRWLPGVLRAPAAALGGPTRPTRERRAVPSDHVGTDGRVRRRRHAPVPR